MPFIDALARGLKPDPILTVSEWSDKYRYLSTKASAEPGKYRTDRTPYLREIMDCMSHMSTVREVIFKKGSQIGATECGNNWIGYCMDYAPAPMLIVQPTVEMAKKFSKQRLEPLIDETPRIKNAVARKKSKDSDNTLMSKSFDGGTLFLTGANSSSGLASMPAKNLMLDEVDRYPSDVGGEGDPSKLAKKRQATFSRRKTLEISTPTVDGESRIDADFETTDKRYYFIPCPHCDHYQTLIWDRLKWDDDNHFNNWYECESCEEPIKEFQKTKMLAAGEWRATAEGKDPKVRGYHLNALYSPVGWYSWADCINDFIEGQKDDRLRKVFINTVLGETYKDQLEQPDWKRLWERSRSCDYRVGHVPHETCLLVAGVDVQRDRLEIEVVGFARNKVSYSIDYVVLHGFTDQPEVWAELEELLEKVYPVQGDERKGYKIEKLAIDSGYNTQVVYDWVRRQPFRRVMAIKGRESQPQILSIPKPVDIRIDGRKTIKRGLKLWHVGVHVAKEQLYSWLTKEMPSDDEEAPKGFCYFLPYGEEYFKMLTAEAIETKVIGSREVRKFKLIRDRNEALDVRVYAMAAAESLGMSRFKDADWDRMQMKTHYVKIEGNPVEKKEVAPKIEKVLQPKVDDKPKTKDKPRKHKRFRGSFL